MSSNEPIRWFRGIREVQPSAFHDPAAVDFPPGTVVGIKTRAPVGQLDLFVDPEWQRRNRVVECDRDGRVIESKPVAIAGCTPPIVHKPLAESTAPPEAVTPTMVTVTNFKPGTRFFRRDNDLSATMFGNPSVDNFVRFITHKPGESIIGHWDTGFGDSGFCNPVFRAENNIVECDESGRAVERAPVLSVGDPSQINLSEPLNATAAPLVTFEVAPTPPISERDAGIVAKLRERGIPLASIAAAVNEATPEQIVECLLDQQTKRLAADHAAAIGSIKGLQNMLAGCALMSSNPGAVVQLGCPTSLVASDLHSALDEFINAKLTGADASADGADWKTRALAAEKNVSALNCANLTLTEQLDSLRQEAADQKQAHTKEIDDLRAAARCTPNDTLLDRVRKLAESSSPSELRSCREQLEAVKTHRDSLRESFERENRLLVKANQELAALRECNARLAKAFDSLTLQKSGDLGVYFNGISAIVQLIAIGVVPAAIDAIDSGIEGAE